MTSRLAVPWLCSASSSPWPAAGVRQRGRRQHDDHGAGRVVADRELYDARRRLRGRPPRSHGQAGVRLLAPTLAQQAVRGRPGRRAGHGRQGDHEDRRRTPLADDVPGLRHQPMVLVTPKDNPAGIIASPTSTTRTSPGSPASTTAPCGKVRGRSGRPTAMTSQAGQPRGRRQGGAGKGHQRRGRRRPRLRHRRRRRGRRGQHGPDPARRGRRVADDYPIAPCSRCERADLAPEFVTWSSATRASRSSTTRASAAP